MFDKLSTLDWTIIIAFLALTLFISIRVRSTASKSLAHFFLGGRNLPWYIAGVSMVATTFAADTPLWVAEQIELGGIARNWVWWCFLIGGLLTTFFFANLWRRANVLTELEFLELRYGGPLARFLRGFKSIYLGLFLNCVVIGWVNSAMISILKVFFGIEYETAFWLTVSIMVLVAIYSSIAGLLGVAISDFLQFIIAMTGSIVLAVIVVNSDAIGGMEGLIAKSEPWRLNFFPDVSDAAGDSTRQYTSMAMFAFLGITWWATWYPGNEPGGGGYISQRMMSAKNEKNAVLSSLFFQLAHYALRPWPWILVGLCAVILYPGLEHPQEGYVLAMKDFLPDGARGFILAAFIGAYMSTISTQLNWGSSYLTNDLYKRFIRGNKINPITERTDNTPDDKDMDDREEAPDSEDDSHHVKMARVFTILIMLISMVSTAFISSIDEAVRFLLGSASGLGAVLIIRWYWYRINALTELVATIAPFAGYSIALYLEQRYGQTFTVNEGPLIFTAAFTTVCWVTTALITKPESDAVLRKFHSRVQPAGWWGKWSDPVKKKENRLQMWYLVLCWISSITFIYATLFLIGKILFMEWNNVFICLIAMFISGIVLLHGLKKSRILQA